MSIIILLPFQKAMFASNILININCAFFVIVFIWKFITILATTHQMKVDHEQKLEELNEMHEKEITKLKKELFHLSCKVSIILIYKY